MMNKPNNPASADRLKTVYIIAAGVPGDKSAEPMAVYYRGIVQPYEMTFKRAGVPAEWGEAICHQGAGRIIS